MYSLKNNERTTFNELREDAIYKWMMKQKNENNINVNNNVDDITNIETKMQAKRGWRGKVQIAILHNVTVGDRGMVRFI